MGGGGGGTYLKERSTMYKKLKLSGQVANTDFILAGSLYELYQLRSICSVSGGWAMKMLMPDGHSLLAPFY